MGNRKVSLDCDDVLADFTGGVAVAYNQKFGTSYGVKHFVPPDFEVYRNSLGPEGFARLIELFDDEAYNDNIQPVPGAREGVAFLKSLGAELYVVTSRVGKLEFTEKWFEKNFPGVFEEIIYAKPNGGKARTKGEICQELGARFHVDDFPKHIYDVSSRGIKAVVFDREWNREVGENALVRRAKGWKDVEEMAGLYLQG